MLVRCLMWLILVHAATYCTTDNGHESMKYKSCLDAYICPHTGDRECGQELETGELRWFLDSCDILEYNCEYRRFVTMMSAILWVVSCHGPPQDRDKEDIAMGRKMGTKWCNMAKSCNHDRVPVCGVSHAGDVMGFRDLCDMFDFNCIRRRNYKQTNCPIDKSILTASRRPTSSYYEE